MVDNQVPADIVVESRGGVIVAIYARTPDTRVVVVDWDDISPSRPHGTLYPVENIEAMPKDTVEVAVTAK